MNKITIFTALTWTRSKWYWWNGFRKAKSRSYSSNTVLEKWSTINNFTAEIQKATNIIKLERYYTDECFTEMYYNFKVSIKLWNNLQLILTFFFCIFSLNFYKDKLLPWGRYTWTDRWVSNSLVTIVTSFRFSFASSERKKNIFSYYSDVFSKNMFL